MTRRLLFLACAFAACAPPAPGEEAVALRRDPLPGDLTFDAPYATGLFANSRLGAQLVSCDEEFYASGSAGVAWAESAPLIFLTNPPEVRALSCVGARNQHDAVVGGASGLWRQAPIVGWQQLLSDAGVSAIDRNPVRELWLLSLGNDLNLAFADGGRYALGTPALNARWNRDGTFFAQVAPTQAQLFDVSNGSLASRGLWNPPANSQFLGPVALGEFNPISGLELALALDDGTVVVFNQFIQTPLLRIPFGRTVAADYDYLVANGQLDALLVGDPSQSRVVRMVGDASVEAWSTSSGGTEFGASIASKVTPGGDRMVGAPGWSGNAGALFLFPSSTFNPAGDQLECVAGEFCSAPSGTNGTCQFGTCLGGVACVRPSVGCPVGWACVGDRCEPGVINLDGGVPDASVDAGEGLQDSGVDAGTAPDASVDAGLDAGGEEDDAGTRDAGPSTDGGVDRKDAGATSADGGSLEPVEFTVTACVGCSSGGDVLALLALLGALRFRSERR